MLKNIDQQLTGKDTVNIDTGSHIFIKPDLFLDHDQCSGLNFTHIKTGLHQFVDSLVIETLLHFPAGIKGNNVRNKLLLSQLLQGLPQLRLKDYDHTDHQHISQIPEDPEDRIHFEDICDQDKSKDDQNALQKGICTCEFDPCHKLIYKKGNQSDLNDIYHAKSRKGNFSQISDHNCQHILHKSPPFFLSYSNRSCLKILQ